MPDAIVTNAEPRTLFACQDDAEGALNRISALAGYLQYAANDARGVEIPDDHMAMMGFMIAEQVKVIAAALNEMGEASNG